MLAASYDRVGDARAVLSVSTLFTLNPAPARYASAFPHPASIHPTSRVVMGCAGPRWRGPASFRTATAPPAHG